MWGKLGPYLGRFDSEEQWRGPHIRVGRFRIDLQKTTLRYKAPAAGDRVEWRFTFYYDRKSNSYVGDRSIYYKHGSSSPQP